LRLPRFFAHTFDEAGDVDYGAFDGAAADFAGAVMGADAHDVEASFDRFEFGFGVDVDSDAAGGAVFDVDGDADGDFSLITKGLEGVEAGGLHETNHVGRGVNGREIGVVRGEGVFEVDDFGGFSANTDGDGTGHEIRMGHFNPLHTWVDTIEGRRSLRGCGFLKSHAEV
jgi:hypothetical protein